MYEYEYYIYHLRPFGVEKAIRLPSKMKVSEMAVKFNISEKPARLIDSNGNLLKHKLLHNYGQR